MSAGEPSFLLCAREAFAFTEKSLAYISFTRFLISDTICFVSLPPAPVSKPSATAMKRTPRNGKIFSI